jgi:hypothetical protein
MVSENLILMDAHLQFAGDKLTSEDGATAVETPISQMPAKGKRPAGFEVSLLFCSLTDLRFSWNCCYCYGLLWMHVNGEKG